MGISGSLQDVSVADVMQFIHLGRRTGTLELVRGRERARIGFHSGRLVSAQAPRTPKLGNLLVDEGVIDRNALDLAVAAQAQGERKSLGQILTNVGALDAQGLRDVIARQIEQAVSEVLLWENGTFDFAIDDLKPIDDIAVYPSDVMPDAEINTQMVLLEAARVYDEQRAGHSVLPAPQEEHSARPMRPTAPLLVPPSQMVASAPLRRESFASVASEPLAANAPIAADELELQIVSSDDVFVHRLVPALEAEFASVSRIELDEAGQTEGTAPPPVVLIDLRRGQHLPEDVSSLRELHPQASLVALVDPGTAFAPVYGAGFLAALPAEVDAVVSCIENVIESRRDVVRRALRAEGKTGVARLRRVFGDLRSGLLSATVALNLMHIISESVERAILFLVKRDQFVALGAFGVDPKGRPLAERSRGLKLPLDETSALGRAFHSGEVQSLSFDAAELAAGFSEMIGRPRSGQVVVFPVLGAQRVISIIYTDNGDREQPIEDIDILELATAQVGMAFENELLRRQIGQPKES